MQRDIGILLPALGAALLAACGESSRAADAGFVIGPDAFRRPDASTCVEPCFAAEVYTGLPTSIAVRDGTVYVAAVTNGDHNNYVGSVSAVGPDRQVLALAHDQSGPHFLNVDATSVYWSNVGWISLEPVMQHEAAIMKIARTGGTPEVIATQPVPTRVGPALSLTLDDGKLYFSSLVSSNSVNRVPITGGTVQTLVQDDGIAGHLRVQPNSLAIHGDNLYWTDPLGAVVAMPKNGGAAAYLVNPPGLGGGSIAVDDQNIYFVGARMVGQASKFDLLKMPLQGGPTTPLVQDLQLLSSLVLDGADLYYSGFPVFDGADLQRVSVAGGTPAKVVYTTYGVYTIDQTYVYWAFDHSVYRMPK